MSACFDDGTPDQDVAALRSLASFHQRHCNASCGMHYRYMAALGRLEQASTQLAASEADDMKAEMLAWSRGYAAGFGTAKRAWETIDEERRMRVQLADDSQRHLDRALAAERALGLAREGLERLAGHHHAVTVSHHGRWETCQTEICREARALLAPPA